MNAKDDEIRRSFLSGGHTGLFKFCILKDIGLHEDVLGKNYSECIKKHIYGQIMMSE